MELNILKPYQSLYQNKTRYYLLYGGRGGGRSYASSQKALVDTFYNPYSRIAVMRQILGDVRSSIWQEVKDRIDENDLPEVTSDQAMKYQNRINSIECKGFKQSSGQNKAKLKSLANYNTVIIEEADEVHEEDFDQLDTSVRTNKADNQIILMFNMPHRDHWIIKRWFHLEPSKEKGYYNVVPRQRDDTTYIYADYRDNAKNLPIQVMRMYEEYRERHPEYYWTMIRGLVSEGVRGRVFKNWKPISKKEFEELPYPSEFGMDFGFASDPTALVEIKRHNKKMWVRELLYERGLTNPDISDRLKTLGVQGQIVADSAEPKSIEELVRLGHNVEPAVKGQDSIRAGIKNMLEYEVFYTDDSPNIELELKNYTYKLDKNKNPTNETISGYDHCMDSIRYRIFTPEFNFLVL